MIHSPEITYAKLPSLPRLLLKALVSRKPGLEDGASMEKIELSVSRAMMQSEAIATFKNLCGYTQAPGIPLPFYYVFAQRLQLALLTDPAFKPGIAGLIHISNSFTQHKSAAPADPFDLRCRNEGDEIVPAGREFEIVTEFFTHGQRIVECRSRFLSRKRHRTSQKKSKIPSLPLDGMKEAIFLPSNTGRRYAKVSGDYNPIHLYALTAKLFGFKKPIAHGIFMLSRVAAILEDKFPRSAKELSVEYKLPVYLPAEVTLIYKREDDIQCSFEVRSADGKKLYLKGFVSA